MGYYYSEDSTFREITQATGTKIREATKTKPLENRPADRYSLTYLLEAADDISYLTADLEDAFNKGIIESHHLCEFFEKNMSLLTGSATSLLKYNDLVEAQNQYLNNKNMKKEYGCSEEERKLLSSLRVAMMRQAVNAFVDNYQSIMEGTFNKELLGGSEMGEWLNQLRKFETEYIYEWRVKTMTEISAGTIIYSLLDNFVPMAVKYGLGCRDMAIDLFEKGEFNPDKFDEEGYWENIHGTQYLNSRDKKLKSLIREDFWKTYSPEMECFLFFRSYDSVKFGSTEWLNLEAVYERILAVTDFISGMTDTYARKVYRQINGLD